MNSKLTRGERRTPKTMIAVGGRFHAFQLAKQLQENGYLERIITSNPRFTLKGEQVSPQRILTFPIAQALAHVTNGILRSSAGDYLKAVLFDKFVSTKVDECDVFFGWAGVGLQSMSKAKQKGIKVVLDRACPHILDQVRLIEEEAAALGIHYKLDRRMADRMIGEYELADVIVVPSKYSQQSFLSRGFSDQKVRIARLSGKFPGPGRVSRRPNADETTFRVLYLGGNLLRKGLVYLLRAWNGLGLKNAELILRTSDRLDNPEIRRLLYSPTIKVLGYQTDLAPLYRKASIFCLPSVDDGFGMAMLEAMSYGLPVIATQNVGAADCIRDGVDGFLVPIRDSEAIKEKILFFYERELERAQMGMAAEEQSSRFTWEVYGHAVVRIIDDLLSGNPDFSSPSDSLRRQANVG